MGDETSTTCDGIHEFNYDSIKNNTHSVIEA